jgi:hypothetical protein
MRPSHEEAAGLVVFGARDGLGVSRQTHCLHAHSGVKDHGSAVVESACDIGAPGVSPANLSQKQSSPVSGDGELVLGVDEEKGAGSAWRCFCCAAKSFFSIDQGYMYFHTQET